MVRPVKKRLIRYSPQATYFKPRAVPLRRLQEIELRPDELEALRLCDYMGYSQQEAAGKMEISQSTLQRALETSRSKVAEALVKGRAIKILKRSF